jgi:hypothetical protein
MLAIYWLELGVIGLLVSNCRWISRLCGSDVRRDAEGEIPASPIR